MTCPVLVHVSPPRSHQGDGWLDTLDRLVKRHVGLTSVPQRGCSELSNLEASTAAWVRLCIPSLLKMLVT